MPNRIDRWSRLLPSGLLGLTLVLSAPAGAIEPLCSTDIDGNGNGTAETGDAKLLLRHLFGFNGTTLTEGAVGDGCTRCDAATIATYLDSADCQILFDVDGNGRRDALTDGMLFWRYQAGLRGDALILGVVGEACARCTEEAILAHFSSYAPPPPPLVALPLNDTGLDWCANDSENYLPCPVSDFPGQDAESGRDVTHNDPSDGHAGFSFTKISNSGQDLPASAALGSGPNDWACTRDNVTGLVWEVKTYDGGLRHQNWTYSWYNPDASSNGGLAGYPDQGDNCFDPARCDTYKYVADVNSQGLCGASDWRLPDRFELESLTSNNRVSPAIDTAFFPNTPSSWFWSSSPTAPPPQLPYENYPNTAWVVGFNDGQVSGASRYNETYVRLVRGGQ
ncbi:MAG: DUF1566 domain-containing protein [Sphingobacteriia bacterium]|nr:DUF1566 domain-containing protein [Sphingobacteriia bacterium]NCC40603.1 DUF1566 domain-containing protein [Gammaproteobacteria bacterium]